MCRNEYSLKQPMDQRKKNKWETGKYLERNKKENTTYQTYRRLLKGELYSNNDYIFKNHK